MRSVFRRTTLRPFAKAVRQIVSRSCKMHYSVRPATLVENTSSVKSRREVTEGLLGNKESISSKVFSVKPKQNTASAVPAGWNRSSSWNNPVAGSQMVGAHWNLTARLLLKKHLVYLSGILEIKQKTLMWHKERVSIRYTGYFGTNAHCAVVRWAKTSRSLEKRRRFKSRQGVLLLCVVV